MVWPLLLRLQEVMVWTAAAAAAAAAAASDGVY
jgi:hypothetical protein